MGKYVVRIPKPYSASLDIEIDTLKNWITKRLEWLDSDLGPCIITPLTKTNVSNNSLEIEGKTISSIYPSPFKDHLSFAVNVSKEQHAKIQLMDINGKVYYQKTHSLQKGIQVINLDLKEKQMASGLYLLHLNGSNVNLVKKVLKE